ncbi:MAG: hypothetical protein ACPGUZ_03825 [Holosporaceae bacterium]
MGRLCFVVFCFVPMLLKAELLSLEHNVEALTPRPVLLQTFDTEEQEQGKPAALMQASSFVKSATSFVARGGLFAALSLVVYSTVTPFAVVGLMPSLYLNMISFGRWGWTQSLFGRYAGLYTKMWQLTHEA